MLPTLALQRIKAPKSSTERELTFQTSYVHLNKCKVELCGY